MEIAFRSVAHDRLGPGDVGALRKLFDDEYLADHGPWSPDQPYGYAPADVHVMAFDGTRLVAHIGFQKRVIAVGDRDVCVAGVGGVLVAREGRTRRLGAATMGVARERMRDDADIAFGYLGCRPEVVPFYESTGWRRIHARERCVDRLDPSRTVETETDPLLICGATRTADEWPAGDIDLRGLPW